MKMGHKRVDNIKWYLQILLSVGYKTSLSTWEIFDQFNIYTFPGKLYA